jgi:hypothetical protein
LCPTGENEQAENNRKRRKTNGGVEEKMAGKDGSFKNKH